MLGQGLLQLGHLRDGAVVDSNDDIALFQTGLLGSGIGLDALDIDARAGTIVHLVAFLLLRVNLVGHIAAAYTQQRALHHSELLQVLHHFVHDGGGDGETITGIAACLAIEHRIDAHQLAALIDQCAT